MFTSRASLRALNRGDLEELLVLTAQDPVVNVFAEHRARTTELSPRFLHGQFLGQFDEAGQLRAACHAGSNLVPIGGTVEDAIRFSWRVRHNKRGVGTLVGPTEQVTAMYDVLRHSWGQAKDLRWGQPHLELRHSAKNPADPRVRQSKPADLDVLYPACVAMYTEEVGTSPELGGNAAAYRSRIAHLINRGWSFVRIEEGQVIFKAEIASRSPYAAQIQGVWTAPQYRGQGIATAAMATVVNEVLGTMAPVVSLYVNSWNTPARVVYERVGFRQTAEFSTVMW
jgi:uncharacterized protein